MTIQYNPAGPYAIKLLLGCDESWYAAHRDEFLAFAQRHADATGHVCEVFAADGATVLDQVEPTKGAA